MELKDLLKYFNNHQKVKELLGLLNDDVTNFHLKGLSGSSISFVISAVFQEFKSDFFVVKPDKESAAFLYNDLCNFVGEDNVLFFPSSYKRQIHHDNIDIDSIVRRTEVLNRVSLSKKKKIIVSYPGALPEKVISHSNLKEKTLQLKKGESISIDFLNEVFFEYGFERTDFVFEPGQYSVRGSIVDVFSYSSDTPFRIDFFGDDVESIRSFDIETQLSIDHLKKISIIPNIQDIDDKANSGSIIEFVNKNTIFWMENLPSCLANINKLIGESKSRYSHENNSIIDSLNSSSLIKDSISKVSLIEFGQEFSFDGQDVIFNTSPQPSFNKDFSLLSTNLYENFNNGFINIIFAPGQKQIDRLQSVFNEINQEVEEFSSILQPIHEGFVEHDLRLCCYTDHQIFERYHKFNIKSNITKRVALTFKEISGFNPGDYVVHSDHGIGKFAGLTRIENNGKYQEVVRLTYKNEDTLLVNIHNLHKISRYKSKEGEPPKINKLGSPAWQKLKQKTKSHVKDIAKDFIALYAKRKSEKGFAFTPDTYLQNELEASFIYEDTPDQLKATQFVKSDMESLVPMDRLICGDVGFGKTEVAIRAAFKAVTDSKQVAILVPTTILAMQHYYTFMNRLKDFPCNIEYISRFKNPKQQKQIIEDLKNGKIDIIIGTHRLVGKDIDFKDLGLLVIDEEQKFGVAVKDKLKAFRASVDTLTLTATPIPRTMQFSLMGARDLSIIMTPPPNRYPIYTELHAFNPEIIKEAIEYELERNGQVFVINNKIQNIYDIEALINKLVPKANTVVGHGQMEGKKLEKIILGFMDGDHDVLIATTIIENGLDIPNANTIIINDAQNFGLSGLHQLRGRVGRSNKKAFCYLISPPLHSLPVDARRRLKAIEDFSELGSGFNIAMYDLDIRGAGNMLGAEQSGFISDIGFETYHKILDEAILELKEDEFKDLFADKSAETQKASFTKTYLVDCNIETDMEILFPDYYIKNITERINLYRQLDSIKQPDQLSDFEKKLIDRFGVIPKESSELLNIVRLRWVGIKMGFEKIVLKNKKMICYFIRNESSEYYQSPVFSEILNYVQLSRNACRMKEANSKLTLSFDDIRNVPLAIGTLENILG